MKLFSIALVTTFFTLFFSVATFADIKPGTYKKPFNGVVDKLTIKKWHNNQYLLTGVLLYGTRANTYEFKIKAPLEKISAISYDVKSSIEVIYRDVNQGRNTVCHFDLELRVGITGKTLFISTYYPNNLPLELDNHQCPASTEVDYAWQTDEKPYLLIKP